MTLPRMEAMYLRTYALTYIYIHTFTGGRYHDIAAHGSYVPRDVP